MGKTDKKALSVSSLIKMLERARRDAGDVEVFVENTQEACFDGVGDKVAIVHVASTGEKAILLIRNQVVLKSQ